jgi:hypothetical protein
MLHFKTEHTYSKSEGNSSFNSNKTSGYVDHEKCILCGDPMHNSVYDNTVKNTVYMKIPWRMQSIWQYHSNTGKQQKKKHIH